MVHMRKTIKASKQNIVASKRGDTIFEDENFEFINVSGTGTHDTPWTGLEVRSKDGGLAYKHAVEIRLHEKGWPKFDGTPVELKYKDAYVAHGMRMSADTLEETREYIAVLEDAVDFAERVNEYIRKLNEGKMSSEEIESATTIEGSELQEYEVNVNFATFVGADEIYSITAHDEEEALEQAIEEGSWDLTVEEIEEVDDGEYEVHVGFCGFVGVEEIYTVYADSEEEAEEDALAQAKDDLSAELVEDEE